MAEDWDAFAKRASEVVTNLLRQAAELGFEHGKQTAAAELRQKVVSALELGAEAGAANMAASLGALAIEPQTEHSVSRPDLVLRTSDGRTMHVEVKRAAPGSVKPIVERMVREHPGLSVDDIQGRTGIKRNSVRGTLWTLSTEGIVERRDDGWYPKLKTNEAADEQSSAAPISQPVSPFAAGGQADPLEPGQAVEHENMR